MATLTDTLTAKLKTAFTRMNIERPADKLRDADGTYVVADLQMLAQQLAKLGARAPNQGVENRLMGLDGVGPAGMIPKIHQVTGAHDAQGQGIVVGGQQLVAGSFDNAPVNGLIDPEVFGHLGAQVVREHLVVQRPDIGDDIVGGAFGGQFPGQTLEGGHDLHGIANLFFAEGGDARSPVGEDFDQAFGAQHLEGLAQRGA